MSRAINCTRIGYVYLPTTDLQQSVAWYTANLGFELINSFEDRGSMLAVLHHPHKHAPALLLIETRDAQRLELSRNGRGFPVMAIACLDIEKAHRDLTAAGGEVEDLHVLGNGEAKYFYFRDDQGHLLEAAWSIWDTEDEFREGLG